MMFMHGYMLGGWMWLVPAAFFILFWGGIFWMVRGDRNNRSSGDTPIEILKQRYARGELSKTEFEEMKRAM